MSTLPMMAAVGCVDPEAARGGDPDIALGIAFHAVGQAGFHAVADAFGEDAAVRRAIRRASTSKTRISAFSVSLM